MWVLRESLPTFLLKDRLGRPRLGDDDGGVHAGESWWATLRTLSFDAQLRPRNSPPACGSWPWVLGSQFASALACAGRLGDDDGGVHAGESWWATLRTLSFDAQLRPRNAPLLEGLGRGC